MSEHLQQDSYLTRRHWLVLAASAVSGCGGGSASTTAGLPGTGGTGVIYSQGSISGFGSVIVNGIKFDDRAAIVQLDGTTLGSADLRLGMVASVQGERGANPTLGTASHIAVWSIAQGLVTNVAQGVATEFTVAGIKVQADASTVFDGLANAVAVATGQRVAVWGLQAGADDSRRWHATRVEVVADTALVSTGLVKLMGSQRGLNGLILTGPAAGNLTMGQLVRVRGALSAAGTSLQIERVDVQGSALAMQSKGEVEIEGLVTAVTSNTRFTMADFEVDVSRATLAPMGAQIAVGSRLEVQGVWLAGVLIATKVELEDAKTLQTVEIEGVIDSFTGLADFVVRGQRCDATAASMSPGTAAKLAKAVKVKLKGTLAGDVVLVTELEIAVND
jgi:Domain of unknown function (DUF5666)